MVMIKIRLFVYKAKSMFEWQWEHMFQTYWVSIWIIYWILKDGRRSKGIGAVSQNLKEKEEESKTRGMHWSKKCYAYRKRQFTKLVIDTFVFGTVINFYSINLNNNIHCIFYLHSRNGSKMGIPAYYKQLVIFKPYLLLFFFLIFL